MKYGIELEFFVYDNETLSYITPAYKVTDDVDGNPVIGEIRTNVHNNIVDCVFELKKLIYLQKQKIKSKGGILVLTDFATVNDEFLKALRKDKQFTNRKVLQPLEELSIYPSNKIGKLLPRGTYKASLQINMSENKEFLFNEYEKVSVEDKYKYVTKSSSKSYASLFDYVSIIAKLDKAFDEEIGKAKRVKGVYAIKEGKLGDRIEYRSLPNTINLEKLIETLI